jgi:hypothetical protein
VTKKALNLRRIKGKIAGMKRAKSKKGRHWYKIKRMVLFVDGNFQEMTGTKPFFWKLARDDKRILKIMRPRRFDKLFK